MKPNQKTLKSLQDKWYAKLKQSGFEDIEDKSGRLKIWALDTTRSDPKRHGFKEEYYRLAGHFLYDYAFKSKLDERIWELHSQGLHMRGIKAQLMAEGHSVRDKYIIQTLRTLKKVMLENWRQHARDAG